MTKNDLSNLLISKNYTNNGDIYFKTFSNYIITYTLNENSFTYKIEANYAIQPLVNNYEFSYNDLSINPDNRLLTAYNTDVNYAYIIYNYINPDF